MTYVYKDGDMCGEHGFVLSPGGTCVRCRREASEAEARGQLIKVVSGGAFLLTLLGFGAAWGHKQMAHETPAPQPALAEVRPVPMEAPVVSDETRSPVTSPDTHAVLDAWQAELARAEARSAVEAAAAASVEKQRAHDTVRVPLTSTETHVTRRRVARGDDSPPSSVDHPSWWQDQPVARPRGSVAAQQRAMAAAGVAPYDATNPGAWLPANNGGNFANRGAAQSH